MRYNDIYAAVNRVKPCRFTVRRGAVSFELIETLDDECGLVTAMVRSLRELGVAFHQDITKTYSFGDSVQYRTYFKVEK